MALHSHNGQDPLMRQPLAENLPRDGPLKLTLYGEAKPARNFRMRREDFGLLLVNRSRVLPVTFTTEPLLDALDGARSLRAIERQFGQEGLNFVGQLYAEGLVRLTNGTSDDQPDRPCPLDPYPCGDDFSDL
jgi:hypothetical protein